MLSNNAMTFGHKLRISHMLHAARQCLAQFDKGACAHPTRKSGDKQAGA